MELANEITFDGITYCFEDSGRLVEAKAWMATVSIPLNSVSPFLMPARLTRTRWGWVAAWIVESGGGEQALVGGSATVRAFEAGKKPLLLKSYPTAKVQIMRGVDNRQHNGLNNGPNCRTNRRDSENGRCAVKSPRHAQRFL